MTKSNSRNLGLYGKHYTLEKSLRVTHKKRGNDCPVSLSAAIPPYFSLQWFPKERKVTTSSH